VIRLRDSPSGLPMAWPTSRSAEVPTGIGCKTRTTYKAGAAHSSSIRPQSS
jgi:hypothetical protein